MITKCDCCRCAGVDVGAYSKPFCADFDKVSASCLVRVMLRGEQDACGADAVVHCVGWGPRLHGGQ